MHEGHHGKRHDKGRGGHGAGHPVPESSEWTADKHVHATVDSINSAVNEMIEKDGGLPPLVPPGASDES